MRRKKQNGLSMELLELLTKMIGLLDATGLSTGDWVGVFVLNFRETDVVDLDPKADGFKDGNNASYHATLSATVDVDLADGENIWFRRLDINASGSDNLQAIDDFSVTAPAVPEPCSLALVWVAAATVLSRR